MVHISAPNRFAELDACRGLAIGMMVIFHLMFDLSFFSLFPVEVQQGPWRIFGYCTAILFVSIAGMAVAIRGQRTDPPPCQGSWGSYYPFLVRGCFIIGTGFLVTAGTFLFLQGTGYVLFGILHLIGLSTLLGPLLFRLKELAIIPGFLILAMGSWTLPSGPLWLAFIGVHPAGFVSVDYTPLIPWFGVFLIGMGSGFFIFPEGKRRWRIPDTILSKLTLLALLGRHSLAIYLVHQPILIAFLSLISGRLLGL
jgi:uncharacterized membrane protein